MNFGIQLQLVYGGTNTNSLTGSEETHVMSEKVQMIASAIYKEFESMLQKFGQDCVKVRSINYLTKKK